MAGKVDVISSGPTPTITIDGNAASISAGGNGLNGEVTIKDASGNPILILKAASSQLSIQRSSGQLLMEIGEDITVYDSSGNAIIGVINETTTLYVNGALLLIDSSSGSEFIKMGLPEKSIELRNPQDQSVLKLTTNGEVYAGGNGTNGRLSLYDDTGHLRMTIRGDALSIQNQLGGKTTVVEGGQLYVGGGTVDGTMSVIDKTGKVRVRIGGAGQEISVVSADASAWVEIHGDHIGLSNKQGQVAELDRSGDMILGGAGEGGSLSIRDNDGKGRLYLTAEPNVALRNALGAKVLELRNNGDIRAGGGGQDGDLILTDRDGTETIRAGGGEHNIVIKKDDGTTAVELGRKGLHINDSGHIRMRDPDGKERIHIDGASGDIVLANADCAEEFDVSAEEPAEAGTVMVLGRHGRLEQSRRPFDKTVAGVISGAGNFKPGIVLDRRHTSERRVPIALVGKVLCRVDARYSAIEVGDLLTTSATPGHAMRVVDPLAAFGAVIGKALEPLNSGQGLIPIMACLQ
jgi:hypothetical protein